MGEGGDILYSQTPTMKPRSQQQLQQTADKARKNIPGVSRFLTDTLTSNVCLVMLSDVHACCKT